MGRFVNALLAHTAAHNVVYASPAALDTETSSSGASPIDKGSPMDEEFNADLLTAFSQSAMPHVSRKASVLRATQQALIQDILDEESPQSQKSESLSPKKPEKPEDTSQQCDPKTEKCELVEHAGKGTFPMNHHAKDHPHEEKKPIHDVQSKVVHAEVQNPEQHDDHNEKKDQEHHSSIHEVKQEHHEEKKHIEPDHVDKAVEQHQQQPHPAAEKKVDQQHLAVAKKLEQLPVVAKKEEAKPIEKAVAKPVIKKIVKTFGEPKTPIAASDEDWQIKTLVMHAEGTTESNRKIAEINAEYHKALREMDEQNQKAKQCASGFLVANSKYESLPHGETQVICRGDSLTSYDFVRRAANWNTFHLSPESVEGMEPASATPITPASNSKTNALLHKDPVVSAGVQLPTDVHTNKCLGNEKYITKALSFDTIGSHKGNLKDNYAMTRVVMHAKGAAKNLQIIEAHLIRWLQEKRDNSGVKVVIGNYREQPYWFGKSNGNVCEISSGRVMSELQQNAKHDLAIRRQKMMQEVSPTAVVDDIHGFIPVPDQIYVALCDEATQHSIALVVGNNAEKKSDIHIMSVDELETMHASVELFNKDICNTGIVATTHFWAQQMIKDRDEKKHGSMDPNLGNVIIDVVDPDLDTDKHEHDKYYHEETIGEEVSSIWNKMVTWIFEKQGKGEIGVSNDFAALKKTIATDIKEAYHGSQVLVNRVVHARSQKLKEQIEKIEEGAMEEGEHLKERYDHEVAPALSDYAKRAKDTAISLEEQAFATANDLKVKAQELASGKSQEKVIGTTEDEDSPSPSSKPKTKQRPVLPTKFGSGAKKSAVVEKPVSQGDDDDGDVGHAMEQ